MDAREDLPKVSIETEQDWKRVQRNFSNAFLERLDKELETRGRTGDRRIVTPCQSGASLPATKAFVCSHPALSFWRHS